MAPARRRSSTTPAIIHSGTLNNFMRDLADFSAGRLELIVCSSQAAFELEILETMTDEFDLQPTMQLLHDTRSANVSFCDSVPALHALLTMKLSREQLDGALSCRMLILLNPISLHRPTASYSAQGIGRAFAAAVATAHVLRARLVVVECARESRTLTRSRSTDEHSDTENNSPGRSGDEDGDVRALDDPWKQQVPLLNATTKSFGPGERGWVGRTIEVRALAQTWCDFYRLPS